MSISGILLLSFFLANYIAFHVALHRFFRHAGKNPWLSLVPVVDIFEWLDIIKKPKWWFFILLVPVIDVFFLFAMLLGIVKCYKKPSFGSICAVAVFGGFYLCYLTYTEEFKGSPDASSRSAGAAEVTGAAVFMVLFVVFFRTFIAEAYMIPTPSMEKTLLVGDFLFVSKSAYGARIPNTPLAFPFVHHTLPVIGTKAYVEWIKLPYLRLPGGGKVKRNDLVVFNYPAGDTVVLENQGPSYYDIIRYTAYSSQKDYATARNLLWTDPQTHIITRPVDKRENYIKRCVAIAGDKLEIKDGELYINDAPAYCPDNMLTPYLITFLDGATPSENLIAKLEMENISDRFGVLPANHFVALMTKQHAEELRALKITSSIKPFFYPKGELQEPVENIFPNDTARYKWNVDNFGPVLLPKKGWTVTLNDSMYKQYERAIRVYENNTVEQRDGKFFINGKETTTYTFKMDYYWMMGDNRHNSQDSRYWGFVPEDHIAGKAWFLWMSTDRSTGGIRTNRLFTPIHDKWAPKEKKFTE